MAEIRCVEAINKLDKTLPPETSVNALTVVVGGSKPKSSKPQLERREQTLTASQLYLSGGTTRSSLRERFPTWCIHHLWYEPFRE